LTDFGVGAALSFGPAGLLGPDDFYPLCRSAAIHVGRPLTIAELARGRSRDDQPAHHPMESWRAGQDETANTYVIEIAF
jgi:hypothetical protein